MVGVKDVNPQLLVNEAAKRLKEEFDVPDFIYYVKSGAHKERPPDDPVDFWYKRLASILRIAYIRGRVGVSRLSKHYGSVKNRGVKPERFYRAGRKIIRVALQQLEKKGYLERAEDGKGRVISAKGRSFLDRLAFELYKGGSNG